MTDAADSEPIRTADAPSFSGEALPAVMVPSGRNAGFSVPSRCAVVPGLMLSSRASSSAGHGDHQVVVEAFVPGPFGEIVRVDGELVLPFPGDPRLVGQQFVALAEGNGPLGWHLLC